MVKMSVIVPVVQPANIVQAREMKFGQMTVHLGITVLAVLTVTLLMMEQLV